jgi:hypothetical protein
MSGNTSATGGFVTDIPPPPPSGDQIAAAIRTMIATLAGLPGSLVRARWQPMPPAQPDASVTWASVGITRTEADDYPYIRHDGVTQLVGAAGPGVDRMQRHSTVTVLVTFYGPASESAAGAMRDGLYIQQNWEPMAAVGLKFRDILDLARMPELVNQQWIDRLDVQIDFRHQIDRVYPILNLDGADVVIRQDNGAADTDVSVREDTVIRP